MMVRKEVLALMGLVLAAPGLEASDAATKTGGLNASRILGETPLSTDAVLSHVDHKLYCLKDDHDQFQQTLSELRKAVGEELPKLKAELQEQKTENEQRFLTLNQKIDELKAEIDKLSTKIDKNYSVLIQFLEAGGYHVTYK